jgi:hypothetical protein
MPKSTPSMRKYWRLSKREYRKKKANSKKEKKEQKK